MKRVFIVLAASATVLLGCGDDLLCVGPGGALTVDVRVAITNEPAAWYTLGIVTDGAFVDTMRIYPPRDCTQALRLYGPQDRAGLYSVRLQRAGYYDWVATDVRVEERYDGCSAVDGVHLVARLRRRSVGP